MQGFKSCDVALCRINYVLARLLTLQLLFPFNQAFPNPWQHDVAGKTACP
jgi:hypothetical protein